MLMAGLREYTANLPARIAGKTGVELFKELLTRWRINGDRWSPNQIKLNLWFWSPHERARD